MDLARPAPMIGFHVANNPASEEQQIFDGERASIAYFDLAAEGEQTGTVLLVHGFASTAKVNWIGTSWSQTLRQAGYRVIALDNRGHGASQKFYDASEYGPDIFAADALALALCHAHHLQSGDRLAAALGRASCSGGLPGASTFGAPIMC